MFEAGEFKKGIKVEIDGAPYMIVQFEFVKPGKGQALYKCKLKNMINGSQFERTYRSGDKLKKASLDEREMEYLYFDGTNYCFMNNSSYEQEFLTKEQIGENVDLLKENTICSVLYFGTMPNGVTLPNFVVLRVVKADPWAKGDTATNNMKPVIVETGFEVYVPPFIEEGELLKIDTRTRAYSERVKG
jgi:elongation factor P